jgi:hypothetical protein
MKNPEAVTVGKDYHLILNGAKPEDEVAAGCAIPGSADPVIPVVVSLLFNPVGCRRSIGILGRPLINLEATIGPATRQMKTMSIIK